MVAGEHDERLAVQLSRAQRLENPSDLPVHVADLAVVAVRHPRRLLAPLRRDAETLQAFGKTRLGVIAIAEGFRWIVGRVWVEVVDPEEEGRSRLREPCQRAFGGRLGQEIHAFLAMIVGKDPTTEDSTPYIGSAIANGYPAPTGGRFFFDYGTEGLDSAYSSPHAVVRDWLIENSLVEGEDFVIREYAGADHNNASWRARLGDQLSWLLADG